MLWEPARLNTSSHPKTLLQQPLTWHNELRDFVSAHIMIAGPAGSTQELNHALLNFPIDQLQSSRYMKAGPPSFVLRCSRSLKNRTYVHVCNSDVGIQAGRKGIQRNGIMNSAGTVCRASLLATLKWLNSPWSTVPVKTCQDFPV